MPVSYWRVFTDTKRPEASQRLTMKLQSCTGHDFHEISIEKYFKGGHVVTFHIVHDFEEWSATVYDVIMCAQEMGHGWSIGGFVEQELDLISTGTSISGIKILTCFCPRPGTANAK